MSRPSRTLHKRFVVFCEGDTEYNYIDKMRKKQGVQLVIKPINMHGGGYSNFLQTIKKEPQSNCLALFVIVDADRIMKDAGEKQNFMRLYEYCRIQNQTREIPFFLIANNPDFEYVACLHSSEYRGQDNKQFILSITGAKDIAAFKSNKDVYDLLNRRGLSYRNMLTALEGKGKLIKNDYDVKKRTFEISIKEAIYDENMLNIHCSNINEFFNIIDW